ncbi:GNAT family N-acetyltransferase [Planctomonas sp. JC2975]|uniref:GNAT family N-acetyltransferase n=1 Tax=Planctomonas sp. JC2975 TaxID=2729626 RepID=UPI001476542B|nr:GNAT family N-acetyltransferase [Planctomonas sp. JC2975]NNC11373.1 GNAT family N-acetyltransferase [Planctomonas sp. JC2975]
MPDALPIAPDSQRLRADLAALADEGWPATERADVDGWVARFASGVTRRANSVYPAADVLEPDQAIATVERLYRDRGLRPVFQLSDDDAELQRVLAARGYLEDSETLIMTATLATVANRLAEPLATASDVATGEPTAGVQARVSTDAAGAESSVVVRDEPDDEWLATWWTVDGRGGAAELEVARRILTGVPSLYATVRDEHGAASVGRLAIVERDETTWGGLYAVATREDARARGHASAVIAALVASGADRGVTDVWLQVMASNAVARRLYGRLGFLHSATYRYLAAPMQTGS